MAGATLLCALGAMLAAAAWGADSSPIEPGFDYHSFANVDQFRVTHLDLDLRVDLDLKSISGVVTLVIKRLDPRATQLVLDTKDLRINDVTQESGDVLGATQKNQTIWVSRPFHLEKPDPILGSALVIDLPPSRKALESVRVDYDTGATAGALQWLTAKQTAGHHKGFLYTQSEPIGTRTWIPLQDTPQVRATYKAVVHTDSGVRAVMSAENDPKHKRNGEYSFVMPQAIPSYLIALAVGDLVFNETGPRTGVYAEKPVAKAAALEFADTESMIAASEKLFGPYRWSRYDILVLPPSFPVGGQENPRLSFITPTVIAGDKSLVSVIAHELAHSWSGNLVSNATWRDVWLNEGITDFLESRIMNAVYGEQRASMEAVLGLRALRDELPTLAPQDQVLAIDLRDRDPGLAFSTVPYEKGRLFLSFLDAKFGHERFNAFLQGYFDHFAFKSISTEQFNEYVRESPGSFSRHRQPRSGVGLGACAGHSGGCGAAHEQRLRAGGCRPCGMARRHAAGQENRTRLGHPAVAVLPRQTAGCIERQAAGRIGRRPRLDAQPERRNRTQLAGHRDPQQLSAELRAARGLLEDHRPPQVDRAAVYRPHEDCVGSGIREARVRQGAPRLPPGHRRGD